MSFMDAISSDLTTDVEHDTDNKTGNPDMTTKEPPICESCGYPLRISLHSDHLMICDECQAVVGPSSAALFALGMSKESFARVHTGLLERAFFALNPAHALNPAISLSEPLDQVIGSLADLSQQLQQTSLLLTRLSGELLLLRLEGERE